MVYLKRDQLKLKLELPNFKCTDKDLTMIDAAFDFIRDLKDRNGDFFCYCKVNEAKIDEMAPFPNFSGMAVNICLDWKKNRDAA